MKPYFLSASAEAELTEILIWTLERFGSRQGDRYLALLLDRCAAIAAGEVSHQSCRAVFAPHLRADLRFARAGRHLILFTETESDVRILAFLHQSGDLLRRIDDAGPAG